MMETAAPGLHDVMLLGASIAGVYLVVALLQLTQLKRHRAPLPCPREPSVGLQNMASKRQTEDKAEVSEEQSFALHLRHTTVEADLQRLQHEVQSLRAALLATQEEIKSLQPQRNHAAPLLYNEAMVLARRGSNAASIAMRCGISMGEAELVKALTQTSQEHKSKADDAQSDDKEANERQPLYGFRAAA